MRARLATRIWVGQLVVLAVAVVTGWAVSALAGPAIFHDHLIQAGHPLDAAGVEHVELAYRDATRITLGLALTVALLVAVVVTWVLWRRISAPLTALTAAATQMARGHYETRVARDCSGAELDSLAAAFNDMADRLEHVEDTRRRLLSDLAHELRTPIATLSGYLDGLEDGVVTWDEATRCLLADQVSRLGRLAGDLDEVSRAEEGRISLSREPLALADVVARAVAAAGPAYAAKGVRLRLEQTEPGPGVHADPDRLGQVVANLLANSLRHSPAGTTVHVHTGLDGGDVVVTVRDEGDGIAAEHLPHVFERFYRVDRARDRRDGGAGIGLTVSRAIVDAHGGSLTATSDGLGSGATLVLRLPIHREAL